MSMPYKTFEENGKFCTYKLDASGEKTGKTLGCHADKESADKQVAALYASTDTEKSVKCAKCGYDSEMTYVPMGVLTFADAVAAVSAKDEVMELKTHLSMFEQVVDNILWSSEVKDKTAAISGLLDELKVIVAQDVADVDLGDEDESKSLKAKRAGSPVASDYLIVEDSKDTSKWHLPVKESGTPNHRLMGSAWAALHKGFRGKQYAGPDKDKAIAKLKKLYRSEGLPIPSEKSIFLDDPELLAVKSLEDSRVGSYAILWGDVNRKDLTGEYFNPDTEELTSVFDTMKGLPCFYNHTLNEVIKSAVIGRVDTLVKDSVGLWYEAELKLANEYDEAIKKLLKEGKLKTSTQTFPVARKVASDGRIERWPIVEVSLTPTPAEPRMLPVSELKSAFETLGYEGFEDVLKGAGMPESCEDSQGAEKARLRLELEAEQILWELL